MSRLRLSFSRTGPGVVRILLVLLLIAWGFFTGSLSNNYFSDIIGNFVSLIVAGLIMLVFYTITLWLAGPHVLPTDPHNKYEQRAARSLLLRAGFGTDVGMAVVREAKVLPGPDNESRSGMWGPGVVDLDSTTAAILLSDTGQSRIKEPGLIFLNEEERLGALVDLRVQLRSNEFEFLTRDGIPVKVRVTVRFQIDQTHFNRVQVDAPAHPLPAPVVSSQHTIRRAVRNQAVQSSGETSRWYDLPLGLAAGMLRAKLADYKFDELLLPQEPTIIPRAEIRKELDGRLRAELIKRGIHLVTFSLGIFFPADYDPKAEKLGKNTITWQRVEAWKAAWESRMLKLMAEAQAEADRQHELARTQAQMELITRVTQALERSGPGTTEDRDQIARRFLATLQRMAAEPYTRERLSDDNLQLLRDLLRASDLNTTHEPPTES